MADEIEFGELHSKSPVPRLRPDENHFYAVVGIDETVASEDLPVYVDLDVMRELEAHAQADTTVELGGVLMGWQGVDSTGKHFVVVLDSIRARHFHATRGSFKFTHETWQQITRDREAMPADLQMVGWYHTHPGWGIFLSGMDDFICENFFNRKLDLALVLDPLQGEMGWFQWGDTGTTRLTSAVFLIGHRHRVDELSDYASQLRAGVTMIGKQKINTSHPVGGGTTVQIIERGTPVPWLMASMMALQWVAILVLIWQVGMMNPARMGAEGRQDLSGEGRQQLLLLERENQLLSRLIQEIAQEPARELATARQLSQSELEKERLSAAVESHLVRIETLNASLKTLMEQEEKWARESQLLYGKLNSLESELAASAGGDSFGMGVDRGFMMRHWEWISLGVILLLLLVIAGGIWFWPRNGGRSSRWLTQHEDQDHDDEYDSSDSRASIASASVSADAPPKRKI